MNTHVTDMPQSPEEKEFDLLAAQEEISAQCEQVRQLEDVREKINASADFLRETRELFEDMRRRLATHLSRFGFKGRGNFEGRDISEAAELVGEGYERETSRAKQHIMEAGSKVELLRDITAFEPSFEGLALHRNECMKKLHDAQLKLLRLKLNFTLDLIDNLHTLPTEVRENPEQSGMIKENMMKALMSIAHEQSKEGEARNSFTSATIVFDSEDERYLAPVAVSQLLKEVDLLRGGVDVSDLKERVIAFFEAE